MFIFDLLLTKKYHKMTKYYKDEKTYEMLGTIYFKVEENGKTISIRVSNNRPPSFIEIWDIDITTNYEHKVEITEQEFNDIKQEFINQLK